MYKVKLEKFEGPLELLLELIEKEKMNITDLSLARVADEYLEYIKNNENIALGNLADFLTVASKLILIKSRALLPMLKVTDEEEEEIKDLAHQLEEYKKFKEASMKLGKLADFKKISYSREGYLGVGTTFYPPEDINAYDIKKYFLAVLAEIPVLEKLQEEVVREVITLEEKITELESSLRLRVETSFSELVSEAQDKIDVIVSFLAMLEMVKQRIINVEQNNLFEEIRLKIKAK
ncbi:MAG TPA: segregation/condensation protein A [Candidatus Moranbacteria bacterium]|nr:segregation/condensation protein A [Candidatus Moranbacteria bacterium]